MNVTENKSESTNQSLIFVQPNRVINLTGAVCPHPLNIIRDAVTNLKKGEILKATSDHKPTADVNVPEFCRKKNYQFEIIQRDGQWDIYIKKTDTRSVRLEVQDITKSFKTSYEETYALENINMTIQEGEFVCIVGPSGCGKSTLLNLIAGLEKPSSGKILVNGELVDQAGPDRVVVFQESALFPWMDILKNVEFGLHFKNVSKESRKSLAEDYLELVGIEKKFHSYYIHQISGGMKQRVAIARALVMEPSILLMDEPFAALDIQTRDILQQELQRIWMESHKTVVFVTHNIQEAVLLGDRVVVFDNNPGRIYAQYDIDIERPRNQGDPWVFLETKNISDEFTNSSNKNGAFKSPEAAEA